jgi:hypothetical protein
LGYRDVSRSGRGVILAMTTRSSAEIVAEYLDCVRRRDDTAVERFFHPMGIGR